MIPHIVSNFVLSLWQQYILMDCFCFDTLDLPPGLQVRPHTPPPPSKVPRHHILVLLPVITTPITSQREQTQPDAKHNTELAASTMDSHDTVWTCLHIFGFVLCKQSFALDRFYCSLYIKWWWLDIFMLSCFENWWSAVIFYEIYISSEGFMWMFPCTGPCNVDRKARAETEHHRGEFFKQRDSFSDTDR